jgi:hypothetical protein
MTCRRHKGFFLALLLGLSTGAGCSSETTVNGEVLLDGQRLKEGVIRFVPADGKSQTASAPIIDGRFTATMVPGEKRVEISAPRVVGKRKMYDLPDSPEVDNVVERLPARYNVRSELTLTVRSGTQEQRFELKSQ